MTSTTAAAGVTGVSCASCAMGPDAAGDAVAEAAPDAAALCGRQLADVVRHNLENQQDWTEVRLHGAGAGSDDIDDDDDDIDDDGDRLQRLPRLLLSGRPPRRLYIHPDEQIAILRAERARGDGVRLPQPPEVEWVLPVHLAETPTLRQLAAVFDAIDALPPGAAADNRLAGSLAGSPADDEWTAWRGPKRGKRLLLAVVQDDSSVVYYFVHDGIVKPRQN